MNTPILLLRLFRVKLLILFLGIYSIGIGQNVSLKSQAEVDAFNPTTTVIDGDLHIGYPSGQNTPTDITNLSNLGNLVSIGGKLTIIRNPDLDNLIGLNNLTSIGHLSFINNDKIQDLDDFESLESIAGDISIIGCSVLESITRLAFLQTLGGNLMLNGNGSLASLEGLENIVEVNGGLEITALPISTLDIFQNVEEIGGSLKISSNNNLTEITGFPNLKRININLSITSCASSFTSMNSFNNLETILGNLRIYSCQKLLQLDGFSSLQEVGGGVEISFNYDLININGLEKISKIGGGITFSNNHDLEEINFLNAITSIGGNLRLSTNTSLNSLLPLSNVASIAGDLELIQNYDLINLDGLNKVKHIGGTLELFNQRSITDLDVFRNLRTLDGGLILAGNTKLNNIDGLRSLKHFDGKIEISTNHNLYDVDGLKSLNSCEDLVIHDNDNLLHINGIINLKGIQKNLQVTNNQSLSNCCGYWILDLNPSIEVGGNKIISNNGPGCDDVDINKCGLGLIEGYVFYDRNMNKIQDSLEFGMPNISIDYLGYGQVNITDARGNFYLPVEEDSSYIVIPTIPEDLELTTDLSQFEITYDPDNIRYNDFIFGMVSPEPYNSGSINLYLVELRCNTKIECSVQVLNDGYEIESGIVRLEFHDSLTVVNADILNEDSLGYYVTFDRLYPFQTLTFDLELETPNELFTGDVVEIIASLSYFLEEDYTTPMDTAHYEGVVMCSFDPNDKQVSPIGIKDENYTLIDDELLYTIRFQNTGNAPAIDVKILDTLDINLDIRSFKVVNSSHELNTSLSGNAVEFLFKNIWLIDSLTNEEESQGYLQYTIKPNVDVAELTEIENTAHIIFDFNPAIVTNTTKNTMVETICYDEYITESVTICEGEEFMGYTETGNYDLEYPIGITCDSFVILELTVLPSSDPLCSSVSTKEAYLPILSISPNPFRDEIRVEVNRGKIKVINLYDIQGRAVATWLSDGEPIDTRNLSSGLYILEAITDDGASIVKKVVKE